MKENNENSFDDDYSIKDKEITNNSINNFRYILENKNDFSIHINKFKHEYIPIKSYSFLKINQMIESFPEENIVFIFDKKVLYTPRTSSRFSRNSLNNRSNSSSFSSSFKKPNLKNLKEEIINTDIINPKINEQINNDINENINIDSHNNNNNNNQDDVNFKNNIQNIQKARSNSSDFDMQKNKTINKRFLIYKWIYHYYIIVALIILLHYITFIYSEYNESFYKWVCVLLVVSLLFVGYFSLRNRNSNDRSLFFNGDNLFWTHFFIFVLTIVSLAGLVSAGGKFKFIESQKIIGYLMIAVYLITLVIEAIYVIYYDVIIEVITWERINNNKSIDEFNKNALNIQLVDVH